MQITKVVFVSKLNTLNIRFTIGLRDFKSTRHIEKRIFKVKEVAAVVLFSAHSLLLECTHSHILI